LALAAFLILALASVGVFHTPAQSSDTNTPSQAEATETTSNSAAAGSTDNSASSSAGISGPTGNNVIVSGADTEVKAGESADTVVVYFSTATIRGKVHGPVVAICGNVNVEGGEVGDAVVAVFGNVKVSQNAKISGDAVAVGGQLDVGPDVKIGGERVSLPLLGIHGTWVQKWFLQCVLKMRPLAPQVGWVWAVAGVFFLVYLLVATVFPRPVMACVEVLERRPATTFLMGFLVKIFTPLIFLVLAVTVIGLLAVPVIWVALLVGAIVGKVALVEWVGFRIANRFGGAAYQKPLLAFLIGSIIVTLLYLVWVVGLVVFVTLSIWGLGVGVTTAFGRLRREEALKPNANGGPNPVPVPPPTQAAMSAADPSFAAGVPQSPPIGASASSAVPPSMPDVLTYPKAGFWPRMGAGFLDAVLVSVVSAMAGSPLLGFLFALAYFAGMWAWKGTTIGGVVLGLKVVRIDGQPVTFVVALVRALAGAFSMFVLFLGILWIAWDLEKQGWHDKIAGTAVVRLPRAMPLVCL